MKKFFAKIGRFFWSWGFLKFILGMIALIIFFYVEEDWRGARAWAATKAEWEAKGETFDYNKFIPPPVPDEQNLAALSLFKLESDKDYYGRPFLNSVALNRAMRSDLSNIDLPSTGNWQKGELPNMAKIQSGIAAYYSAAFKGTVLPGDTLAQFDALYPFLGDLRTASTTRPFFRLTEDYTILPPGSRALSPIADQIKLSKILTLHAVLAVDHHQSDLALVDIKLNYQLLFGVKRDPTLIGGLVAIGMAAINDAAIYDGLAQHAWSDAQLVELEQTLKPVNFLADYQFAMRCEVVQSIGNFEYYEKLSHRNNRSIMSFSLGFLLPDGWWDQNKSQMADALLGGVSLTDPKAHRVYVDRANQGQQDAHRFEGHWTEYAPWNIIYAMAAGPILNATVQYAHAQTWLDEARIACALERYHLVHGVYPDSLEALVPASIDAVPCDPINGEAYHYRVRPDGTFLLYSVGWNQKDDGGVGIFALNNSVDLHDSPQKHGDWVWPTPWAVPAEQGK